MSETESIDHFNDQLDVLIENFVAEHDVSVAAMIGALSLKIYRLQATTLEDEQEDHE